MGIKIFKAGNLKIAEQYDIQFFIKKISSNRT